MICLIFLWLFVEIWNFFKGIDCGSVLSAVISNEKPCYELIGMPCLGARTLMQHANCYGIMVSEEIYLALRPRNFNFDSRPIRISKTLNAYVFEDNYIETSYQADETDINSSSLPIEQTSTSQHPSDVRLLSLSFFFWKFLIKIHFSSFDNTTNDM